MTSLMRIDPKLRKAAKEYQDEFKRRYKVADKDINRVLPLTKITQYFGETKIPSPDYLDSKILKWKYAKKRR